ncbi:MAG TPA: maleylpyruvate isomerase N-terminal domain-containing protein [Euzebyales bacterium]|nr:maleylpyruvate isomerase N-terminal domain-containing protein [Euzebyales bacterium]
MDDDVALDVLRDAAEELADTAVQDLSRDAVTYPGWSIADLVVHTGRIHRWVTEIVRTLATQRLAQPDVAQRPDDLIGWFRAGAADVMDALAATSPTTPVWTFAGEPTVGFWRRRMALETTIHRWDVQRVFGDAPPIADDVAVAGVTEALEIYLEPRLRGAEVCGDGEIVGLRALTGANSWAVRLQPDAIEVLRTDHADAWVEGTPADLWLFLMGRAPRDVLDVRGPAEGVDRLERAIGLLSPPAR